MQRIDGATLYSATDLANFLECEHLAALDLAALGDDALRAARSARDESAELFAKKGDAHERAHLERLRAQGLSIVDVAAEGGSLDDKVARTLDAMRAGVEVVYQAALRDGALAGHADFLRRVDGEARPSARGATRSPTPSWRARRRPSSWCSSPSTATCWRALKGRSRGRCTSSSATTASEPTARPTTCATSARCSSASSPACRRWRKVATPSIPCPASTARCATGASAARRSASPTTTCARSPASRRTQMDQAAGRAASTPWRASRPCLPEVRSPRIQADTLEKLRSQAALQDEARRTGQRRAIVLPPDAERRRGFHRLPLPDEGDLFFDMEGDPLEDDGLEYLFGVGFEEGGARSFTRFWAHDRAEERLAFEQFMDFVVERRARYPDAARLSLRAATRRAR